MAKGKFATTINCMDGRVQEPVNRWMKENYCVDFVDVVTEPGPDDIMVNGSTRELGSIKRRVLISVEKHGSRVVSVVGHHDCAGNPVSKEEHLRLVCESVKIVSSWGLPVKVVGLWVGEDWGVEKLDI